MKRQLRIYFDYTCPYCYHGILDLLSMLPDYPGLTAEWAPCEAHPLPEHTWAHSNLASQTMMAVAAYGGNLLKFHKDLFEACFVKKQRIDDSNVLIPIAVSCGADREKVALALQDGRYRQKVEENNILAWETMGLEAVPCYQSGHKLLTSHEDVMIPKKKLQAFLDSIIA